MSLSDRLDAAARARDGRPDVLAPAPPARPAPFATDHAPPIIRIVGGATRTVDVIHPDPDAPVGSVCPTCGRGGELGVIDLPYRTADWSCTACGTLWQVKLPPSAD